MTKTREALTPENIPEWLGDEICRFGASAHDNMVALMTHERLDDLDFEQIVAVVVASYASQLGKLLSFVPSDIRPVYLEALISQTLDQAKRAGGSLGRAEIMSTEAES